MSRRAKAVTLLAALAMGAAGCGQVADASSSQGGAPGTLAARVNGIEISMQQLASVPPGARGANPAQALEKVIDRELLVQKAIEARLDRDPQVVQQVEDARRELLARAYVERSAGLRARATPEEVGAFYEENPALFAQRRIYRLRELAVAASQDKFDMLRAEIAAARDLDEVAGWLKWRNLKVSAVSSTTQAAEQLPLAYLPQLARMKEGDIALLPGPLGAAVVQLVHAQEAPLSGKQAAPLIEQFLSGRKRLELAAAEVKRLRGAARIEYVGDFKR